MSAKAPNNIMPASDNPNWGDESFDYFRWFKFYHFKTLEKYYKLIEEQYQRISTGNGYCPEDVKLLLIYLDELIKLYDWLPDTSGGTGSMDTIMKYRNEFEELYLNKGVDTSSYWLAQEIRSNVFTIYNYMEALCEDINIF